MERFNQCHYGVFSLVLIILFSFSIGSAKVPNRVKQEFLYCFDGEKTDIASLININGFYHCDYAHINSHGEIKDACFRILFYENGLVSYYNGKYDLMLSPSPGKYFNYQYWGMYKLCGDTIKVDCLYKTLPGVLTGLDPVRLWFVVLGKNNMSVIKKERFGVTKREADYVRAIDEELHPHYYGKIAYFIPLDTLPPPDNAWVLKEKFFWCDEKRYEAYRKNKVLE